MAVIKYGIIGCGSIAKHRHIPEINKNPYSKIVALSDPVAKRVKTFADKYKATAYTDYKKMLKNEELDAVVVCTPNYLHAKISIDALRTGCHVLCEKPMAATRAEAKRMIAEAKKARKYLMIGLNQRYELNHIKAKEIIASGKLGKVLTFRTAFAHGGPEGWSVERAKTWFFRKKEAIMGATGDLGIHKADLMRFILGQEFTHVCGFLSTLDKKYPGGKPIDIDDTAYLTVKTNKNAIGTILASWTNYGGEGNYTAIYCQNGTLSIGSDQDHGLIVNYKNGNRELYDLGSVSTNKRQISSGVSDDFTNCIRKKRKPSIDGLEGYKCLDVILTAMEAATLKKTKRILSGKK